MTRLAPASRSARPTATDLSILGRDVLNHFDVILSRRNNEVLLLAPNHRYRVEGEYPSERKTGQPGKIPSEPRRPTSPGSR